MEEPLEVAWRVDGVENNSVPQVNHPRAQVTGEGTQVTKGAPQVTSS